MTMFLGIALCAILIVLAPLVGIAYDKGYKHLGDILIILLVFSELIGVVLVFLSPLIESGL